MAEIPMEFEALVRGMLEEDIVKFGGPFKLKGGKQSVAYTNLRDMISIPHLFIPASEAYAQTLDDSNLLYTENLSLRHIEAIPEAAVYYGGAVGYLTDAPLLYHRVKPKSHGEPRTFEGRFDEGDECILLDDVITDSGSKINEAAAQQEVGIVPVGVVVLIDREQGGRTEVEAQGMQFASALTLSGIAKYALDEELGGMTHRLYRTLLWELDPLEVAQNTIK